MTPIEHWGDILTRLVEKLTFQMYNEIYITITTGYFGKRSVVNEDKL